MLQGRTGVHRDDQIRVEGLFRRGHRQVLHQGSIHILLPLDDHRPEPARNGHGGSHRLDQITIAEDSPLTCLEVGGQHAQRTLEPVEIPTGEVGPPGEQTLEGVLHLHAAAEALGQEDPAVVPLDGQERVVPVFLLAQGLAGITPQGLQESPGQVKSAEEILDLAPREAAGVEGTHQGAGAGAGDAVQGIAHFLQALDDPNVSQPPRPATAQGEGHAGRPGDGDPGRESEHHVRGLDDHVDAARFGGLGFSGWQDRLGRQRDG